MDTLLKDFIDRLESLPDKPSLDTLKTCVLETDGRQLPIKEYTSFSDQGYKRNVVHVSGKCEIAVICFKKEQFTPIHDHGGSIGVTIVREGTMTEELFVKQPTGMIAPAFTRKYRKSELAYINTATIHRISNTHIDDLVTINIYFPPLTLMNLYNLENTQVEKWFADYSSLKGLIPR
ncbi:MAG: cysteine dioxygenase family protein [Candidatus Jettenia sp.]|nr:MAG: cysteine dioxygenase family protein [Candidatus Jettenia sp.]